MSKPIIFISHIIEEKEIAISLKELIEKKFLQVLKVFVSSHEESLKLGDDWLNIIRKSMTECSLLLVICSPISVSKPWINFEAGGGWVRGIPVIPLCHSGLTPGELPAPLNSLQGGTLNDTDDIRRLFSRIADESSMSAPEINQKEVYEAVGQFEKKIIKSMLIKDTQFVHNFLLKQVALLKYSILASILDTQALQSLNFDEESLENRNINFNDIYNLFNISLAGIFVLKKVFQELYETVGKLSENIKFILSSHHLRLAPELKELLYSFLYSSAKVEDWQNAINTIERNKEIKDSIIKMVKEEPLPPTRKFSNAINQFIDYYESLIFFKQWLINYENELETLLEIKKEPGS